MAATLHISWRGLQGANGIFIHVWCIYLHEWLMFMVNVGKYTSPMDGMGKGNEHPPFLFFAKFGPVALSGPADGYGIKTY